MLEEFFDFQPVIFVLTLPVPHLFMQFPVCDDGIFPAISRSDERFENINDAACLLPDRLLAGLKMNRADDPNS